MSATSTNSVVTPDGRSVRVRIDPTLAVEAVIAQLCAALKIQEPSALFLLKDEMGDQITDENLQEKIRTHAGLKLVKANSATEKGNM